MKKKYIIPVAKVIAVEYLLMSGSAVKGPEVINMMIGMMKKNRENFV